MKSGWARERKICGPRVSRRDAQDQAADAVADADHFARDLLVAADDALGAAEVDDDVAELDALDDAGDDFVGAVLELLILALALGVADLLEDDLLGGLGGDPAEFDRRQRIDDEVAHRGVLLELLRALQIDLLEMILGLLDHFEHPPQAQVAGDLVELGADVVLGAVTGAGGALDRVLHRLDDDRLVDQFLARDGVGDGEQLGLVGADGGWRGCGGHDRLVLLDFFDGVGAVGAERRGGVDQAIGQDQLGRGDRRQRGCGARRSSVGDADGLAVDPDDVAGDLLAPSLRLGELEPRFMARPSRRNP